MVPALKNALRGRYLSKSRRVEGGDELCPEEMEQDPPEGLAQELEGVWEWAEARAEAGWEVPEPVPGLGASVYVFPVEPLYPIRQDYPAIRLTALNVVPGW